jgi:galactokinase
VIERDYPDFASFIETVKTFDRHPDAAVRKLFDRRVPVTVTRAPGRLDVMGGIADYSGSLVLQRPIAEATFVALQKASSFTIEIVSLGKSPDVLTRTFVTGISSMEYAEARRLYAADPANHWASYVAGAWLVLMREKHVDLPGVRMLIKSSVPEGKGVASSAALEVAVMSAIAAACDITLAPQELALLCQKAENHVAGAACGIMDQMTSVFGQKDSLLVLLCQPAVLEAPVVVPNEITFWGVDSGERHAVGGSSYESVRTGAFMGHRILSTKANIGPYLANVSPSDFEREFVSLLPEEISGAEFLSRYGETFDPVTRVDPGRTYKVRQPTAHPVYENDRVHRFRDLLCSRSEEQWTSLGELMYQSHASYTACGLGSSGTDAIVEFVRSEGPAKGLYGARITGGGSGGTVAVLGRADAGPTIAGVAERYRQATGYRPLIFSGSSNGAASFGSLTVDL